MYTLVQLLTEVGSILLKIKENAKLDQSLPKEPLSLVGEALIQSQNERELQANLKKALSNKQGINIGAMIEYSSILTELDSQEFPLEKFGIKIMKGQNKTKK